LTRRRLAGIDEEMVEHDAIRALALSLPEVTIEDHHGIPSYRVRGKIFATLPDEGHAHLMLPEETIRESVGEHPGVFEEKWWGKTLTALRVSLGDVEEQVLRELLGRAWRFKAPRSLLPAHDADDPFEQG
jgi:hypothetical protein